MDELQKLYDVLSREGKYTKSFQEFKAQWNDDAYKSKVFDVVSRDGLYTKDKNSFLQKYSGATAPTAPSVEKKSQSVTTASPSEDTSLGSQSQKPEEDGILSKVGDIFVKGQKATLGLAAEAGKSILGWADDIVNAAKEGLRGEQFFDDKVPDSDKPITDAVKNQTVLQKMRSQGVQGGSPLDVGSGLADIAKKIINSTLSQEQKNSVIENLAIASNSIKKGTKGIEQYQKETLPEGSIPVEVAKGIVGFLPEIGVAALMKSPQAAESRLAAWAERTTAKASPFVKKVAPKAAKLIEEAVVAPMTKIMAVKGALHGVATTEKGESPYMNSVEGALKGAAEGIYMHGLGEAAGKVSPIIAKQISRTGLNSAIATGLSTPLANAGVFTTARALRTAAEKGRMITAEEAAMEAGTGIGFSLLHLGSQYNNHKEANHYYESVLKNDPAKSLFRVLNETKDNLDLAYNPELTPEKVKELEDARDELKKAIVKEPDLKTKKLLGDEAVKIQNQLDAHNSINGIVENRDALIEKINENENLDDKQKEFFSSKVNAIADTYDQSEFGASKREFNAKINEAQKKLDAAAEVFTNSKTPSDRAIAKSKVDEAQAELNGLNNQLTELITNKQKEDAIQKQKSDEALLRTGEEELGLQQMGEGDTKIEVTPEQEELVNNTKKEFQEILDNPSNYSEQEVNEAKEYFTDPIAFQEKRVAFWEDLAKNDPTEQSTLDYVKAKLEAHKALEAKTAEPTDIERRKSLANQIIDYVWDRLAKQGITNADSIIGTRDTIENVDLDKFWSNVIPEDLQRLKKSYEQEKQKQIDSFEKYKGEFDPTTGTFTSDDTSFYDKKIKDIDAELAALEAKTTNPTPEAKTALQQATEARKSAKARLNSLRQGLGINPNARLEALVDYHRSLVKEAKEFIKEKVDDINEWAKSIGENVNVALIKAWDEAKGITKEIQTGDELGYDLQDIFGEEISKLPGYEETMRSVQDYADFSTRNKEYWQNQVEQSKKSGNKQREAEAKVELAKYTEGNIEKAMEILEESELYKSASDVQREDLVRDVRSRFELKEKKAPSPEELFGDVSDANKVMEEINFLFDDANKSKDYLDEKYRKAKEALDANPTSQKLKENLDKAKAEVEEYKTKNIDQAIAKLKESESYKKANPDQQAKMEKYLTDKFMKSQTEKILPTKLFGGAKDIKKVTITEKKRWKDQFSAYLRGQKDTTTATKIIMKEVADAIDNLSKKGEITAKQASVIIKKMSTLKVFDTKSVDKFVDYVSKVFADAEYNNKLNTANDLRGSISKLASAKGKDANLVKMAKEFGRIKPSMVEDIDAYNNMATRIKESLRGSRTGNKEEPLKVADMVKIADVAEYTKNQLEAQEKAMYDQRLAEMNELFDTDLTGATLQELIDLARSDKPIDKEKETIIRDAIKKMFGINSSIIKRILEKGKDPFTDEPIDIPKANKKLISKFMDMDLDKLPIKDAISAMDSLSNFLRNESIAGMETVVSTYTGRLKSKEFANSGIKAKDLKFYGRKDLGRILFNQIATLPNVIERMFNGTTNSAKFEDASGMSELKRQKTLVRTVVNQISNEYVNRYYKLKANGKDFTDSKNIVERGMIAFLKRSLIGTPEEIQAEFNDNKGLIEQSIDALKIGSEKEKSIAKVYEEVYNKILKDSNNISDVTSKSDNTNIEAVNFWIDRWANIYDQLADVSESVYNKILEKDMFYSPKRMSKLFNAGKAAEIGANESLFHGNNGTVYKKKTGSLESVQRLSELPKNNDTGNATRFVDLSFDRNNLNSMYDALMDINTSGVVRQIEAFFNSPDLAKIIPSAEDRSILFNDNGTGRIQDFIRASRNKEIVKSDEAAKLIRKLNTISSLGTSAALGSFFQPIKQIAPVALNTLVNTKGRLDLNFNGDKNDFMNRIGYGISVRGVESNAQIESINKMIDLASRSNAAKATELIQKASNAYLDLFLKRPDVFIAKASWISYYEKALKKQGIDPSSIDYKTHEVNTEAADYAQKMVDRQQNISDTDLQGKLLGSKDSGKKFAISTVMPFASFRLNQFIRASNDANVLFSSSSSTADRKTAATSLTGYMAEMLAFKVIGSVISLGMGSLTNYLMSNDETDEEYQKRYDNIIRGQITGTVTDVLSPLPPLDYFYAKTADGFLNGIQYIADIEDEDRFKLMTNYKTDILKSLGTFGIAAQRGKTFIDAASLASTGEYTDEYGRVKYITQNDREALNYIATMSFISNFGVLPSEANTIAKNAVNFSKRRSSTLTPEGKATKYDAIKQRKDEKIKDLNDDLDVLNEMLEKENNQEKIDELNDMVDDVKNNIEYIETSDESKVESQREERKSNTEKVKELLGGYESRADLRRYDPILYERNFGKNSKYYKERKIEIQVKKDKAKIERKLKDKKYHYYKQSKNK